MQKGSGDSWGNIGFSPSLTVMFPIALGAATRAGQQTASLSTCPGAGVAAKVPARRSRMGLVV